MNEFPDRDKRTACWNARDQYWECLDQYSPNYNRNNTNEKLPKECENFRKMFESNCPSQWIKHFDRKRTYELFKKKMEKGYDPLDEQQQQQNK